MTLGIIYKNLFFNHAPEIKLDNIHNNLKNIINECFKSDYKLRPNFPNITIKVK